MEKHINFEDNIFILNTRIRMLRDMLLLDAEADFFLEKTLEDVEFIGNTLSALQDSLNNNTQYIDRDEQFHNLGDTERQFLEVLSELLNGDGPISAAQFPVIREKVTALWSKALERRKTADSLSFSETDKATMEPVVSSDELNELLKDMK
ncbi:hypothetical protein AGMMS50267_03250 [Spirochaetia bacterium]|nr:hypothetical protein AGMMS50267_03250 [Spirochaetia bacterium]